MRAFIVLTSTEARDISNGASSPIRAVIRVASFFFSERASEIRVGEAHGRARDLKSALAFVASSPAAHRRVCARRENDEDDACYLYVRDRK